MKKLWDKLARTNSKYYINSDKGRGITEKQFRDSGDEDYHNLIIDDELLFHRFNFNNSFILDLGAGTGRLTEFMLLDFRAVVGIDISGEMIELARERLRERFTPHLKLMVTDGYKIPLGDNCFDIVFSYLVFQHFKERKMVEANFKEVYRVLKPKGIFKVRIRSDKVDKSRWWGGVEYTEQSIGKLIKKVGFKLLKTETVGHYGFWLWLNK